MIVTPKMPDPSERRQFWRLLVENRATRNLLEDLFNEAAQRHDTIVGVRPDDLARKQGVVEGLLMARDIILADNLPT